MIERIETPRLILRKGRQDDLEAIWNNVWRDDSLAERMLWQPTHDRASAEERLARTLAFPQRYPVFFVCLRDTDEPIGLAGVREEDPGVWSECGICVAARRQGQGYGREILRALLALVFDRLGGERFLYSCFRGNTASAALCRSCGFVYTHSDPGVRERDGFAYLCDHYELQKAQAPVSPAFRSYEEEEQ